jgi:hypothetical protein
MLRQLLSIFRLESKELTPRSPRRGGSRFGDTSSQSVSRDEFDKSGVYLRIYVICIICSVIILKIKSISIIKLIKIIISIGL